MNWRNRFFRKGPAPGAGPPPPEPEADPRPAVRLPLDLYAIVVRQARRLALDPDELAARLLRESLERRQQAESLEGRWKRLTPRERQVAWLAGRGLSNYQIAGRLCLSPDTVKNHLRHAKHRLDLPTIAQLRDALGGVDWEEEV
jgi:DNA-binding CsgD family transcriptional regulator